MYSPPNEESVVSWMNLETAPWVSFYLVDALGLAIARGLPFLLCFLGVQCVLCRYTPISRTNICSSSVQSFIPLCCIPLLLYVTVFQWTTSGSCHPTLIPMTPRISSRVVESALRLLPCISSMHACLLPFGKLNYSSLVLVTLPVALPVTDS